MDTALADGVAVVRQGLARVTPAPGVNSVRAGCVVPVMEAFNDVHVSEPGLLVIDVAAADDETAFALHAALSARWATTSVERTTRDAGQAGVRLRCYLDMRQPLTEPAGTGGP